MARSILISDFDGTITERDFYALVLERCMGPRAPDYWGQYGRGEITHFEAMRAIFAHAPADEAALAGMVAALRPDERLADAVGLLQRKGWDVAVVSAGSSWYIERILAGLDVPVYANPGHIEPGRGLVLELPRGSPFFSPETGIDKEAVVRDALAKYKRVAFAGDGPPDLQPALLVPGTCRFARGWLARELSCRNAPFRAFQRWRELAQMLAG